MAQKPGLGAQPTQDQDPTVCRGWGSRTRTGMGGLTREQPEGAPRHEEEGQHVGQRDPARPRTASPARSPAAPQPQQSPPPPPPGIFSPRPSAPQRPAFPRGCGVSAGGGGPGARSALALAVRSAAGRGRAPRALTPASEPPRPPGGGGAGLQSGRALPTPAQRQDSAFWGNGQEEGRAGDARGVVTPRTSPMHDSSPYPRDPGF
ncbi:hypothetical protein G4228_006422 [Cervus hanglu yarkandensis]|nr:hypothetical protein G4228_006422 [Cervus hanglu yarkandensis]